MLRRTGDPGDNPEGSAGANQGPTRVGPGSAGTPALG